MGKAEFGRNLVFNGTVCGEIIVDTFVATEAVGNPRIVGDGFWDIYATQGIPLFDLVLFVGTDGLAFCDNWMVGKESPHSLVVENCNGGRLDCRYLFF